MKALRGCHRANHSPSWRLLESRCQDQMPGHEPVVVAGNSTSVKSNDKIARPNRFICALKNELAIACLLSRRLLYFCRKSLISKTLFWARGRLHRRSCQLERVRTRFLSDAFYPRHAREKWLGQYDDPFIPGAHNIDFAGEKSPPPATMTCHAFRC